MRSNSRDYLNKLSVAIESLDALAMDEAIDVIRQGWQRGNQIIALGNGGSAVTAIHFMTDWSKMISAVGDKPFRGRTLIDNIGMLTAYANDVSFSDVFSEPLKHTAQAGDVVLAISGSGNSENVIRAVELANAIGCTTIGLCGFGGGKLRKVAQHVVWVDIDDMQICEDLHAVFGHIVMQSLCGGIKHAVPGLRSVRRA
jgi:D-sedoheptulose 7-phosphate isomerase